MNINSFNFNFIQMIYFLEIVEKGTLSEAAKILNVSQSTLSKSIQSLEQNFNMQLFIRSKGKLLLTDSGQVLYRTWKNLALQIEKSLEIARNCSKGGVLILRIGVLNSHQPSAYLLEFIKAYRKKNSQVQICVEADTAVNLRTKLEKGELDIIFTVRYEVENGSWDNFSTAFMKECPLMLCMLPQNPLAKKDMVTISDLKQCNLTVLSSLCLPTYNNMLQQMCAESGFKPNIIYSTADEYSMIYHLVQVNDAFIFDEYHRDFNTPGTVSVPIEGTKSGVAAVWNSGNAKHSLRNFLDAISVFNSGTRL